VVNSKENVEIVVQLGIKQKDCKSKMSQNCGQNSGNHNNFQKYANNGVYCTYCRCPGHIKSDCYKLKNKSNRISGTSNNAVKDKEF
jgi:hypothetical protein